MDNREREWFDRMRRVAEGSEEFNEPLPEEVIPQFKEIDSKKVPSFENPKGNLTVSKGNWMKNWEDRQDDRGRAA